jgi:hypothetical protein
MSGPEVQPFAELFPLCLININSGASWVIAEDPKEGIFWSPIKSCRREPMVYEYQEYPKYLYRPKLAPEGQVFHSAEETQELVRKGWIDTPAQFPKPSRIRVALVAIKPWWSEWE